MVRHGEPGTRRATPTLPKLGRMEDLVLDLWYKNAVIYCLDVATLMDADGRRAMGRRAREHVIERYTWARCAELLERVYEEIA